MKPKIDINKMLPVAFGLAGFYLVYRLFFKKTETEKAQEAAASDVKAYVSAATAAQTPTKSRGEWALIADTIYNDLKYSRIDDDHGDAIYQLARCKNDADVATLIDIFGKRQEYLFGIPVGDEMALPTFVRGNLNTNEINVVNDNYKRKGIRWTW